MADRPILQVVSRNPYGRPPRSGARARTRIDFMVTDVEREDLVQIAKAEKRPLATVIRDAVNEYVADFRDRVVFVPSGDSFKKKR